MAIPNEPPSPTNIEAYSDVELLCSQAEELLGKWCRGGFNPDEDAMVITETEEPYSILHTNKAWSKLCRFSQLEADGNTCSMLHGALTDNRVVRLMMHRVVSGTPCTGAYVMNYKADGTPFLNEIQIVRSDEGRGVPSFLAAKLREVDVPSLHRRFKEAAARCKRVAGEQTTLGMHEPLTDHALLTSVLGKRNHDESRESSE